MKESRQDRFRRVMEARVNKLIHSISLIGNCSNRSVYDYTDAQVEQVFSRLQTELDCAYERFRSNGAKKKNRFSLRDPEPEANAPIEAVMESICIPLPDGTQLHACGYAVGDYPAITIYRVEPNGGEEPICFAEYNPTKPDGQELHIGAYQSHTDETTYYEPYKEN